MSTTCACPRYNGLRELLTEHLVFRPRQFFVTKGVGKLVTTGLASSGLWTFLIHYGNVALLGVPARASPLSMRGAVWLIDARIIFAKQRRSRD